VELTRRAFFAATAGLYCWRPPITWSGMDLAKQPDIGWIVELNKCMTPDLINALRQVSEASRRFTLELRRFN
jgi:hypothetical protein